MKTIRLTTAQALIAFLKNQFSERDGQEQPFFAGCFGIFGHGNLAGIGQALQENPDFTYYQSRNEQAMVHTAVAFARAKNRLQTFACTSSIGPGATNMVTGAALATINRLPVLLLPGDIFASRIPAPVLQQLESAQSQDVSVNDCFKPVSRYWDRINRPEQLLTSLPEAMRVLLSPAETGAVTLAMPQDVQAESFDFPSHFFAKRVWSVPRQRADLEALNRAAEWIKESKCPLIVSGGGTIYSEAMEALSTFAEATGIAVCETQAGKGSMHCDHDLYAGAMGATGIAGANILAREADLIIGIGTRYSDFTTASKTAFQNPSVRFININTVELDSYKHSALPLTGDARAILNELVARVDKRTSQSYRERLQGFQDEWQTEWQRLCNPDQSETARTKDQTGADKQDRTLSQAEVIGIVNAASQARDVVVCAAGSLPGDLHKLWKTRDAKGYHVEYGYSCMGYEIAGGLGIKMASPDREVFVMVGDGSYLMMSQEIVTAVQEGIGLTIILIDNHGYASIGGLSRSLGSDGFGTSYRYRDKSGQLSGEHLPVDFATNASSLGAVVCTARTEKQLKTFLAKARSSTNVNVVVVTTDVSRRVPGYESWWDVPVAEVSTIPAVQQARIFYEQKRKQETTYFAPAEATKIMETV